MATHKKPEPAKESPELIALRAEADALRRESAQLKDMAGRAQADLQNAKDRLERERQDVSKFALEGTLRRLLPTIDNFQRAFTHLPADLKDHDWVKGVAAIEQELVRQVTDLGLQKMESLGAVLDPTQHEVLQTGPGEQGKVIEVFEEGYVFNGKVLRPAKVRVGDGGQAAS
ncbi:nucleotide exchange factor GrpE [Candidatus Peribacteria bacterium RIFOXYC1_FULL_58_8]|nr:MAG: nucleotide exchange factor GrpE [Candidatus Peribacteria bacterium RIFOXYB1_FULL_57_12]OGJ80650.1 MAG: nucleotide exchange factor GrpE [Candidatus Peribacteria bacterium RIFOXYC1_FULL_58_8]